MGEQIPTRQEMIVQVPVAEAVEMGAVDPNFFCHFFFPKTFRQEGAVFDEDLWEALVSDARFLSMQIFRGGAKTTRLRAYTAWLVAYAYTNTSLYIGKSEGHAIRSVEWLQRQIVYNKLYAQTFGLVKGSPWTGVEIDVYHTLQDLRIRILGMGITGSVRGINVDDWRPDTIILDDVIDEENSATPEQRNKIEELIGGAIKESLAPRSEKPYAKMVMLQTPLDVSDYSMKTESDPEWRFLRFSCFDEDGGSRWESRFPTKELVQEKDFARQRNKLSIWYREKECKVIGDEQRYFSRSWLEAVLWETEPEGGITIHAIDPSPPKDEEPEVRRKRDPDPEVHVVLRLTQGHVYILAIEYLPTPDPEKSWLTFVKFRMRYRTQAVAIEDVAYQKSLKWYFEKKLSEHKLNVPAEGVNPGGRKKTKRIRQTLVDIAAEGRLHAHASQTTLLDRWEAYPDVDHDDDLDALAIGVEFLQGPLIMAMTDGEFYEDEDEDEDYDVAEWRGAP